MSNPRPDAAPGGLPGPTRTRGVLHTGATGIFRRKPIPLHEPDQDQQLKRSLGLWSLTAIGLGAIIGAGMFTLAGGVARTNAGPGVTISFVVAGIAAGCAALSYAEFGGLIPKAGSAYSYGSSVLGEIVGWFIGWDLLLEYTAITAVVAIGISGYLNTLLTSFGLHLPSWMLGAPSTGHGHKVELFAVVLCLLVAYLLNRGIRSSVRAESVLVVVKIAIVVMVVVVGAFYIKTGNYAPYLPYGFGGAVTGAATVFFAMFGFDAMSTAAEESRDAQRVLPKAILLSLGVATVLYLVAATVLTGMQHYRHINTKSAFATAFQVVGQTQVARVVAIGAVVGIITVMFSVALGASRVWYAISRDGLLPAWFAQTNRNAVPHRPTWIIGIVAAGISGFVPILQVAQLTNIGILVAFIVVSGAVVVLRYRAPQLPRTFRCPWMPFVPVTGIAFSLWLMTKLSLTTWIRFGIWLVIGAIVYAAYGYRHSRLGRESQSQLAGEATGQGTAV
jgi:APA family basic amino acid/polyamine antiporter